MKTSDGDLTTEMSATLTMTCTLIRRVLASRKTQGAEREQLSSIQSSLEEAALGMMTHLPANWHDMHKAVIRSGSLRLLAQIPQNSSKGVILQQGDWESLLAVADIAYIIDAHARGANYGQLIHPLLHQAARDTGWDALMLSEDFMREVALGDVAGNSKPVFGSAMAAPWARLLRAIAAHPRLLDSLELELAEALSTGQIAIARMIYLAGVMPPDWVMARNLPAGARDFCEKLRSNHGQLDLRARLGTLEVFLSQSIEDAAA